MFQVKISDGFCTVFVYVLSVCALAPKQFELQSSTPLNGWFRWAASWATSPFGITWFSHWAILGLSCGFYGCEQKARRNGLPQGTSFPRPWSWKMTLTFSLTSRCWAYFCTKQIKKHVITLMIKPNRIGCNWCTAYGFVTIYGTNMSKQWILNACMIMYDRVCTAYNSRIYYCGIYLHVSGSERTRGVCLKNDVSKERNLSNATLSHRFAIQYPKHGSTYQHGGICCLQSYCWCKHGLCETWWHIPDI